MMWFIGQKLGTYDILCAEYCGLLHSYMLSTISVIKEDDFNNWLVSSPDIRDEHPGLTLLKNNACLSCHTRDGSRLVGPSFKGLIGKTETIIVNGDEQEIIVDNKYIINKINTPSLTTVVDYPAGLMTPYAEILSEKDINNIIEYISTLK
jgi:cytochrome c oxidase subunit 2